MGSLINRVKTVISGERPALTGWAIELDGNPLGEIGEPTYYNSGFQYYRCSWRSQLPSDIAERTMALRSPDGRTLTKGDFELHPAEQDEVRIRISEAGREALRKD